MQFLWLHVSCAVVRIALGRQLLLFIAKILVFWHGFAFEMIVLQLYFSSSAHFSQAGRYCITIAQSRNQILLSARLRRRDVSPAEFIGEKAALPLLGGIERGELVVAAVRGRSTRKHTITR